MKPEIPDAFDAARFIKKTSTILEPQIRKYDRDLADKVKKMGDAAGEVVKHVETKIDPKHG